MDEGPSNGGMLYHEVQESKLCAVHCVNTVLQGPFFSELDLAAMASDLDRRERQIVLEGGAGSEELFSFEAEGSHNVSMDGDFSIQVLEKALEVWDLKVIPLDSPLAEAARVEPQLENAFICHLEDHWFCIRKVNGEWYNFDSLYAAPQHLSKFFLSAYLDTLKGYGWSIFLVRGNFPKEYPVSSSESLNGFGQWFTPEDAQRITKTADLSHISPNNDESLQFSDSSGMAVINSLSDKEEQDLNAAIVASLRDNSATSVSQGRTTLQDECQSVSSSEPLNRFGQWLTPEDAMSLAKAVDSDPSPVAVMNSLTDKEEQDLNAAIAASLKDNSATSVGKEMGAPHYEYQSVSSSELLNETGQVPIPEDAQWITKSADSLDSPHCTESLQVSNPSQTAVISSLLGKEDQDLNAAIALSLRDNSATSLSKGRSSPHGECQ